MQHVDSEMLSLGLLRSSCEFQFEIHKLQVSRGIKSWFNCVTTNVFKSNLHQYFLPWQNRADKCVKEMSESTESQGCRAVWLHSLTEDRETRDDGWYYKCQERIYSKFLNPATNIYFREVSEHILCTCFWRGGPWNTLVIKDLFMWYFELFVSHFRLSPMDPVYILIDNLESHLAMMPFHVPNNKMYTYIPFHLIYCPDWSLLMLLNIILR